MCVCRWMMVEVDFRLVLFWEGGKPCYRVTFECRIDPVTVVTVRIYMLICTISNGSRSVPCCVWVYCLFFVERRISELHK
jgi:hypothetical protein